MQAMEMKRMRLVTSSLELGLAVAKRYAGWTQITALLVYRITRGGEEVG